MTLTGRPHSALVDHGSGNLPTAPGAPPCDFSAVNPLVTIMIPTYCQAGFLGRAIESALAQDYSNLEIVVSDDASIDGTPELVGRFAADPRVRYVRSATNRGRVGNYRHSLQILASGEFVLNLDGDDWLSDPSYISDAIALIMSNPEMVMVFGRSRTYDESNGTFGENRRNTGLPTVNRGVDLMLAYAEDAVVIPHGTALYRRDVALELGFYEVSVLGADSVALLSMLPGRIIGFIDRPVGVWRKHTANATWTPNVEERLHNFAIVDVPAAIAAESGVLLTRDADRWSRRMATVLSQSFVEDCLARGSWWIATRYLLAAGMTRPRVSAQVVFRLAHKGALRLMGGNR